MSRHKLHIVFWSVLDVALYPVIYMLTVPYFMDKLGAGLFGIWMFVNAILVSGQLFNMGLGTATLRNVSRFLSSGNSRELSRTVSTNLMTTLLIGLLCLAAAAILVFGINRFGWFNLSIDYVGTVTRCLFLIVPLLLSKFIEQILLYALKAHEHFIQANILSMISRFGNLGIYLLLVSNGFVSLPVMLTGAFVITMLVNACAFYWLRKAGSGFTFEPIIDQGRIKEEIRFGKWAWLQSLMVIIAYQSDRFMVMTYFGPEQLGYYAIVSTMFNHIHMCFSALAPWVFPKVSKMVERGEQTQREYFRIRGYIIILSAISLWLFYLANPFLLNLWLGNEKYQHIKEIVNLFIPFELLFVFTIVPYMYSNSAGHEKLYTRITAIYTFLNMAGMLIGCQVTGSVNGLIWGLILSTIPGMIIQNAMLNKAVFKVAVFQETVVVFIPSLLFALAIFVPMLWVHLLISGVSVYGLYKLHYVKHLKTGASLG